MPHLRHQDQLGIWQIAHQLLKAKQSLAVYNLLSSPEAMDVLPVPASEIYGHTSTNGRLDQFGTASGLRPTGKQSII